jgi:hypothetical protein
MTSRKQLWLALATAPVLVALLAAASASRATEASVRCAIMKNGSTETVMVESEAACAKLGGQVVTSSDDPERRK